MFSRRLLAQFANHSSNRDIGALLINFIVMKAIDHRVAGSGVYYLWVLCSSSCISCFRLVTCRTRLLHFTWNIQRVHHHSIILHLQQPVFLDGASFRVTLVYPGRQHIRQRIGALSFECLHTFAIKKISKQPAPTTISYTAGFGLRQAATISSDVWRILRTCMREYCKTLCGPLAGAFARSIAKIV